jgi:hypothetical protein
MPRAQLKQDHFPLFGRRRCFLVFSLCRRILRSQAEVFSKSGKKFAVLVSEIRYIFGGALAFAVGQDRLH